jgi:hypothetical protein
VLSSNACIAGVRELWRQCGIDFLRPQGGHQQMRWKISRHGHDPRQVDLLAIIALLVLIVSAYLYFIHQPETPDNTAFIVPSQSVRW